MEIDDHVAHRAVTLVSMFILNECHPAKSINLLRHVCEDADYERTQAPSPSPHAACRLIALASNDAAADPLPASAVVLGLPLGPVVSVENLVDQPNGVIVGNPVFERGREQHQLVALTGRSQGAFCQ